MLKGIEEEEEDYSDNEFVYDSESEYTPVSSPKKTRFTASKDNEEEDEDFIDSPVREKISDKSKLRFPGYKSPVSSPKKSPKKSLVRSPLKSSIRNKYLKERLTEYRRKGVI